MSMTSDVCRLLDDVLLLKGRGLLFTASTPLLGALPELDSMAVLALLTAIETEYSISISDDDIDGSVFATVDSLVEFIEARRSA